MFSADMQTILALVGGVFSLLLGVLIWFIRRVVIKVDKLNQTVTANLPVQKNDIKHMADKIEELESVIKSLSNEIKNFGALRERVAVIEARIDRRRTPRKGE